MAVINPDKWNPGSEMWICGEQFVFGELNFSKNHYCTTFYFKFYFKFLALPIYNLCNCSSTSFGLHCKGQTLSLLLLFQQMDQL